MDEGLFLLSRCLRESSHHLRWWQASNQRKMFVCRDNLTQIVPTSIQKLSCSTQDMFHSSFAFLLSPESILIWCLHLDKKVYRKISDKLLCVQSKNGKRWILIWYFTIFQRSLNLLAQPTSSGLDWVQWACVFHGSPNLIHSHHDAFTATFVMF